jgi:hypothetical protein
LPPLPYSLPYTCSSLTWYSPPSSRRFVSNLTGSSLLEIAALSTIVPVAHLVPLP